MQNQTNKFYQQFSYIVIDKAHIIWSWKTFRRKYDMIRYLIEKFPKVPTITLLAIVIPNALEYICKLLQFWAPSWLYKESLYQPNTTYFIVQIIKPDFEKLDHLLAFMSRTTAILKTVIFIDNIDMDEKMAIYLQAQFSSWLYTKVKMLIEVFSTNITMESQIQFLENFHYVNIKIWLCI